jgi:5-carboxymethyl-2-hydroxymuconic-semialdehyde dehydrogenase
MDKATPKDVFQANFERAASLPCKTEGRGHRAYDRRQDRAVDLGRDIRHEASDRRHGTGLCSTLRVADALEAGMIWLNSENVRHLPTPFGGVKSSGIGRDGGDYSFDFYMETKRVSLARGTHRIQRLGV